jgi:hypothetical protein
MIVGQRLSARTIIFYFVLISELLVPERENEC